MKFSIYLNRRVFVMVYPCKPQFYCKKVGFNRVKTVQACSRDAKKTLQLWLPKMRPVKNLIRLRECNFPNVVACRVAVC